MFCPKCGKQLVEGAAFCPGCGSPVQSTQPAQNPTPSQTPVSPYQSIPVSPPAPAPQPPKQPKASRTHKPGKHWPTRVLAICVIAALVVGAGLTAGILTLTGRVTWRTPGGMKDPDKLVEAYLDRLLAGDVEGVIALCDLPGQMERMDVDSYLERMGLVVRHNFPPTNEATQTITINQMESSYSHSISTFYAMLLAPESEIARQLAEPSGSVPLDDFDQSEINEFLVQYAGQALRDVQIVSTMPVELDQEERQRMVENLHALYGSENYLEYLYLLERNGHYFAGGVVLEQAGGVWNIKNMNTYYSDLSSSGPVWLEELDGMSTSEARQAFIEQYQRATD